MLSLGQVRKKRPQASGVAHSRERHRASNYPNSLYINSSHSTVGWLYKNKVVQRARSSTDLMPILAVIQSKHSTVEYIKRSGSPGKPVIICSENTGAHTSNLFTFK